MTLTDWKIGTRLSLLAGVLLTMIALVGLQGWLALARNNGQAETALRQAADLEASVNTARAAQVKFKEQVQEWKNLLLRGQDPKLFEQYRKAFAEQGAATDNYLHQLEALFGKIGLAAAMVQQALASHRELGAKYAEALKQYDSANPASAQQVDQAVRGIDRAPTKQIDDIVLQVQQQSERMRAATLRAAQDDYRSTSLQMLAVGLAGLIGCVLLTVWLVRSIVRPMHSAVLVAETVAAGDLTAQAQAKGNDETAHLLRALGRMNESLSGIVAQVRGGSEAIAAASGQIAAGNQNLSARTEEQASALEETAAAMEQLTSTVKQNSEHAHSANQLAQEASEVASQGGSVVSQVVETMNSIDASSKRIVDIIGVIDGIAFQTNILALNAAVEAARAGEQGRGFAVVAGEVRSLAQRAAAAAKEIKTLINDSSEKVDAGTRLAHQAGTTMERVVTSVKRVTDIIGEIAGASSEQISGIEQINISISQIDQVTQENAALVEQAAAATEAMQHQADELVRAVGTFRIDGAQQAAPVKALAAPPARLGGGQHLRLTR